MRTSTPIAAAVACGLCTLGGCAAHHAARPAAAPVESPTTVSAEQTNEQLQAALEREFPLGTPHAAVIARANELGFRFVQEARVVDAQGHAVPFKDVPTGETDFAARGWHIEMVNLSDDQLAMYQFPRSIAEGADLHSVAASRGLMFVFGPDYRLRGISVSPAMGSNPTRMLQDGFTFGDATDGWSH